jgi:tyrosyl-tRNA synthetase
LAEQAEQDWSKQFQRDQIPESAEEVALKLADVAWSLKPEVGQGSDEGKSDAPARGIRLDRLLVLCGLADSATDAARKLKQGAVRVNDQLEQTPRLLLPPGFSGRLSLRVGRRVKIAVLL